MTGRNMTAARAALQRLCEGNQRFVAGRTIATTNSVHRAELIAGQKPFAVVLGCADSRVPVEHVFDQGFGDLFVIRVAGNIATTASIGSAEYAVATCRARLIVVMGHTHCGAVTAALQESLAGKKPESNNLRAITDSVRPAVEPLLAGQNCKDLAAVLPNAVRANVVASVDQLRCRSPLLEQAIQEDGLLIVGAEYSLETGAVTFHDGDMECTR